MLFAMVVGFGGGWCGRGREFLSNEGGVEIVSPGVHGEGKGVGSTFEGPVGGLGSQGRQPQYLFVED